MATDTATLLAQYAAAKTATLTASKAALDQAIHDVTTANQSADLAARESLIRAIAAAQVARFKQATTSATSLTAARTKAAADLDGFKARVTTITRIGSLHGPRRRTKRADGGPQGPGGRERDDGEGRGRQSRRLRRPSPNA